MEASLPSQGLNAVCHFSKNFFSTIKKKELEVDEDYKLDLMILIQYKTYRVTVRVEPSLNWRQASKMV